MQFKFTNSLNKTILPVIIFVLLLIHFTPRLYGDEYHKYVKEHFGEPDDHLLYDPNKCFIVLCPDKELGKKILKSELKLYKKYHRIFKTLTFWKNPAVVKIFANRESYVKAFNSYSSSALMAKFNAHNRQHRFIASWIQDDLIDNLIPHETAHIFVADLARIDEINSNEGKQVLPLWVNEGIAQFFETNDELFNYKLYTMYMAFKEKGFMPFDYFFTYTRYPQNTYYFYIQADILTRFLLSQKNGSKKIRNYITIFRSKVKDGKKAFNLSFPEYADLKKLEKELIAWTKAKLKKYKPDITILNSKIAKIYKIKDYNEYLYKEVAFANVAYQLNLNKNYKRSLLLANAAIKQKNKFYLGFEAKIQSLFKLDKTKSAEAELSLYKKNAPKNAYRFTADLQHIKGNYYQEVAWLKKLLAIDKDNGFYICMRIAYIYNDFLGNYDRAHEYASRAKTYPQFPDEIH